MGESKPNPVPKALCNNSDARGTPLKSGLRHTESFSMRKRRLILAVSVGLVLVGSAPAQATVPLGQYDCYQLTYTYQAYVYNYMGGFKLKASGKYVSLRVVAGRYSC